MSPYKLRRRLMEDVPEVKIYPILMKSDYTEESFKCLFQFLRKNRKD